MSIPIIPPSKPNITANLNRRQFFEVLFQETLADGSHFIELRPLCRDRQKKPPKPQQYFQSVDALLRELDKPQPQGVDLYFGVHPRNKQRGTNADIDTVACLYADVDFKRFSSQSEAAALIEKHKHSIIVETGHGYHVYALLKAPIPLNGKDSRYIDTLKAYQQALNSDPVHDLPRILRVPGSLNYKEDQPVECKIVWADYTRRFDLNDFAGLSSAQAVKTEANSSSDGKIHEGQGRNVHLTSLAGSMRNRGMSEAAILAALREENKVRCSPPLPENEIKTVAYSISKYEPGTKTFAEILKDSGFDSLDDKSTPDALIAVLERLRDNTKSLDRLKKILLREEASKRLETIGIKSPKQLVDAALRATDQNPAASNGPGKAVFFEDPEPWPDPVDGASVLEELTAYFGKYAILPKNGEAVLALWTLYTYVFDAFDVAPYILLISPEKRCGKTRTLDLKPAWFLSEKE